MLVLITGLPGTGKSTIANHLARRMDADLLRTDEIRKHLFAEPTYSEEEKELVYKAMFLAARYLIKAGRGVIIEGTFYKRALRERVYRIAEDTKSKLMVVECTAPEWVVRRRTEGRATRGASSEADYEVYKKIREQYEPLQRPRIVLDTSRPLNENLRDLYRQMGLDYMASERKETRSAG